MADLEASLATARANADQEYALNKDYLEQTIERAIARLEANPETDTWSMLCRSIGLGLNLEGDRHHQAAAGQLSTAIIALAKARQERGNPGNTLIIKWHNDDIADIKLGGKMILEINYDNYGSEGMAAAITVAKRMARSLNVPIRIEGEPGRDDYDDGS